MSPPGEMPGVAKLPSEVLEEAAGVSAGGGVPASGEVNKAGPPPGVMPTESGGVSGIPAGGIPKGGMPAGAIPPGGVPKGGMPAGAIPAGGVPKGPGAGSGAMAGAPAGLSARPYIRRALSLLGRNKPLVGATVVLSLLLTLLPFVVGAAFGPLMQMLGASAAQGGLDRVWDQRGSLYAKADPSGLTGLEAWLATPLSFATIFAVWAAALVLTHVTAFMLAFVNAQLERRLITQIRQDVHDHMQSLSLDFFQGGQTGGLMMRVLTETQGVQRLLTKVLLTPLIEIFVLILALLYLIGLSWQMTLIAFILAPLVLLTFRYTGAKLREAGMGMAINNRELASEVEETISGISDIQVFNAQPRRSERFHKESSEAAGASAALIAWINVSNSGAQVFIALSTAAVLLAGILFGPSFGLTVAGILVFVQFVPNVFSPIQLLISAYTDYQSVVPNVVSTYQLLDTRPSVFERPDAERLGEVHGNIVFEDVAFGYSPNQKILDGLSFSIREGETVALVGAIGSGKSTIFNLLLRFLDPQRGLIVLDGHDISRVTLSTLREQVSKLSQFPFFMKDTIRENIRLGRQGASDAEVEEAARLAHIHDVIVDPARMGRGYDTVVDVQVPSGGQKRLIAMARCLLRKPEVLLLDEPTENLDADQRVRLTRVIREYARDRTCMVISHDMDFIAAVADRIIVLSGGRVAEEGSHAELLARGGLYQRMYDAQNVEPAPVRADVGGTAAPVVVSVGVGKSGT